MKFCMITTFYGSNSFGGDAAFVDRLSRAWRGAVMKSTSFIVETPSKSSAAAKRLDRIKPYRE